MKAGNLAKGGTGLFVAWAVLHVLGGGIILSGFAETPASGYSVYNGADGDFPALSGAILGYFAYLLICISITVIAIGVLYNWKNSKGGLAVNTVIVLAVEIGLLVFLVFPGFVAVGEAMIGLALAAGAIVLSGTACSREHSG
ncbi:MAG: hypothetical protein AAFX58_08965 [Pseudomonadota bacterium]